MNFDYDEAFQIIFTKICRRYNVTEVFDAKLRVYKDVVVAVFDLVDDEGNSVRKSHTFEPYAVELLVEGIADFNTVIDYV